MVRLSGAELLRQWRTGVACLSQAKLAKRLGVRQPAIAEWEAGKRVPQGTHMATLHTLSGGAVPIDAWSTEEGPMHDGHGPEQESA
jgi:transcriptional regulator with XRE-family HTH domain